MIKSLIFNMITSSYFPNTASLLSAGGLGQVFLHSYRSLVLFSLKPYLEDFDLVFEKLGDELAELIEVHFSRFVLSEDFENMIVLFVESGVCLAFDLVAFQELSDEVFHLIDSDGTLVVSVDGVIDILGHLSEFINVD